MPVPAETQDGASVPWNDDPMLSTDPLEFLWDENFTPEANELRDSIKFIQALRNATLDNGDLDKEIVERIWNPPSEPPDIHDPDEYFSLKQFLACIKSSEQTYRDIQQNHNLCHPDDAMLSVEQVKKKLEEWTGVSPIQVITRRWRAVLNVGPVDGKKRSSKNLMGTKRWQQRSFSLYLLVPKFRLCIVILRLPKI